MSPKPYLICTALNRVGKLVQLVPEEAVGGVEMVSDDVAVFGGAETVGDDVAVFAETVGDDVAVFATAGAAAATVVQHSCHNSTIQMQHCCDLKKKVPCAVTAVIERVPGTLS